MADIEPSNSSSAATRLSMINVESHTKAVEQTDQTSSLAIAEDLGSKADIPTSKSLSMDDRKINSLDFKNIPNDIQTTDSMLKKKWSERRIIAEDPEWNLAAVESLSMLALQSIVKNFQEKPFLNGLPAKYKDKLVALLSIDIALPVAANVIHNEPYWKRRAQGKFKLCKVSEHNNSWKQLFFEEYIQELIEAYVPKTSGKDEILEKVLQDLNIAADYVEKLDIRQLRPTEPPELNPKSNNDFLLEGKEQPKELIIKANDPPPDHFDLKDLTLFYGVLDCGINFNWAYFGMTLIDCQRLADSLRKNLVLTSLSIRSSCIDDDKCRILAESISKNSTLKHLNLSYNNIGDVGAQSFAKVLSIPGIAMESIDFGNNKIMKAGAKALAKALTINKTLKVLSLRLNSIGDEGCIAICLQACKNQTLESLNLSGNGIGPKSASSICVVLRRNLKQFLSWDLSSNKLAASSECNDFGGSFNNFSLTSDAEVIGKSIFEATNRNKYITRLDLRMTNLSEECIIGVQGILKENSLN